MNALITLESNKNRNFVRGTMPFFQVTLTKLEN